MTHIMMYKYEAIALKICHGTEYQRDKGYICSKMQDESAGKGRRTLISR